MTVPDVKTKFSCKTPLTKSESGRCETEAFVRDFPQKVKVEDVKAEVACEISFQSLKVEDVKTKLSCETPLTKSESGRCETEASVRDFPQKVKVEDVKTEVACETSFKK